MKYNYTLILNTNGVPISIISYRRAISLALSKKIIIVSSYSKKIKSENLEIQIPSIAILKKYINVPYREFRLPTKKKFLYARDGGICQYCGISISIKDATIEHIIPVSRIKNTKIKTKYSILNNVVIACKKCNSKKADKTPQEANMSLIYDIEEFLPSCWINYLN